MRNRAKCLNCGDVIESKYRYDFVACSCFRSEKGNVGIFIDGGDDYWKVGGCLAHVIRIDDNDEKYR